MRKFLSNFFRSWDTPAPELKIYGNEVKYSLDTLKVNSRMIEDAYQNEKKRIESNREDAINEHHPYFKIVVENPDVKNKKKTKKSKETKSLKENWTLTPAQGIFYHDDCTYLGHRIPRNVPVQNVQAFNVITVDGNKLSLEVDYNELKKLLKAQKEYEKHIKRYDDELKNFNKEYDEFIDNREKYG